MDFDIARSLPLPCGILPPVVASGPANGCEYLSSWTQTPWDGVWHALIDQEEATPLEPETKRRARRSLSIRGAGRAAHWAVLPDTPAMRARLRALGATASADTGTYTLRVTREAWKELELMAGTRNVGNGVVPLQGPILRILVQIVVPEALGGSKER